MKKEKFVVYDGWCRIADMFDTWEDAKVLHTRKMLETKQTWFISTLDEYNNAVEKIGREWMNSLGK